ncbi:MULTISPECIES: hypothetical protein [unclassified Sphingomonas]|uniref:hypothetical protein n=1 Tax=unclassified Sphingomonas TaxID=196159 RepID=UPI0006F9B00F|nr:MULTISPECIES: hypothetical protein [unclassified Sphingomonas]KQS50790.1 hypothetical protein ASG20_01290 [Sphingomonas sp. Leaf198]RMB55730.1 hypothetical protein C8J44_0989 [Sphingomonas sp. PP-CE-3A-406]
MTTDRGALAALLATMTVFGTVLGTAATSAVAQTEPVAPVRGLERLQTPGTQPTSDASSIPVPAAPTIVLPSPSPTPSPTSAQAPRNAPSPRATTTTAADRTARNRPATNPAATDRTTGQRAANRSTSETATQPRTSEPEQTRTSTPAEPPVAAPTQEPVPAPQSSPSSTAPSEAAPQPAAPTTTAESTLSAPETGRSMPLWLSLTAIVVVLGALWALRRKPRGSRFDRIEPEAYVEPTPEPAAPIPSASAEPAISSTPASPVVTPGAVAGAAIPASAPKFLEPRAKAAPTPPASARARLTCELRPLRAGLNMLSATVECELIITNTGTASAEAIRTGVALLTAHADQDMDIAQFNAAPVVRPAAPPFALAAGETRTIRTVAAIAREAIRTMTAANRPMFVPVLATNILYATAGDDAQTARAWVVGIERTDSAKLAPFWLDGPAKMFTTVAARPHAATFER